MYYKILRPNPITDALESCHSGRMTWIPGIENSVAGEIERCCNGLHLCRVQDISCWLKLGAVICPATLDIGSMVEAEDQIVTRAATISAPLPNILDEKVSRLLACDFAERVLLRRKHNGKPIDNRSWNAVVVARQFARGQASRQELRAAYAAAAAAAAAAYAAADGAAYDAAAAAAADAADAAAADAAAYYAAADAAAAAYGAAAYAAADAAAYAAADAADAYYAAYAAAADAADAAYGAAAYAAADAAAKARQKEREWQGRRVLWACGLDIPEPKLDEEF